MDDNCKDAIFKYCPRCVIRFLNLEWSLIIKSEIEIKKHLEEKYAVNLDDWFNTKPEETNTKRYMNVCNACLGILQEQFVLQCFNSVVDTINNDCYEFDSYQTYFILPVQLLVTDHIAIDDFKKLNVSKHSGIEIKEVLKALVEPKLSQHLKCERSTNGVLEVSINIEHEQTELEILPTLKSKSPNSFKDNLNAHKKRAKLSNEKEYTMSQVKNAMKKIEFTTLSDVCSDIIKLAVVKSVKLFRIPVYIGGRYNKYSRDLPQTPWLVGGERKRESSVEEYITGPIMKSFLADDENFSSSGREDVDVRMLGNGRPFLVELVNPRKSSLSEDEMKRLQEEVNGKTEDVAVSNLKIVSKSDCKKLKEGEQEKTKSYSAVCYFILPPSVEQLQRLDDLPKTSELVIRQRTPIRVLHRRPLAIRPRTIHSMAVSRGCDAMALLDKGCDVGSDSLGVENGDGDKVVTDVNVTTKNNENLGVENRDSDRVVADVDVKTENNGHLGVENSDGDKVVTDVNVTTKNNENLGVENRDSDRVVAYVDVKTENNGNLGVENRGGDRVVTTDGKNLDFLNDNRLFILDLNTQAGTYIKEFVHGDFGRTSPKLGDLLLGEVDILKLDVKSVDIKWPP